MLHYITTMHNPRFSLLLFYLENKPNIGIKEYITTNSIQSQTLYDKDFSKQATTMCVFHVIDNDMRLYDKAKCVI